MTNRLEPTWPEEAKEEIKRLRKESAKHRLERNEAREALVELARYNRLVQKAADSLGVDLAELVP